MGGTVEVRGGDRPEDYVPLFLNPGEHYVQGCGHLGADCDCGAE